MKYTSYDDYCNHMALLPRLFQFEATTGLSRNIIITTKCYVSSMGKLCNRLALKDSLLFFIKKKKKYIVLSMEIQTDIIGHDLPPVVAPH